jgi:RES domain-containing protein
VLVWRITREPHQALDGEGARPNGGRWNSEDVPADLVAIGIRIPGAVLSKGVDVFGLPAEWNRVPDHPACIERGDTWLRTGATAVLRAPSPIVPQDQNVLVNPNHADARSIRIVSSRSFVSDPRLLR